MNSLHTLHDNRPSATDAGYAHEWDCEPQFKAGEYEFSGFVESVDGIFYPVFQRDEPRTDFRRGSMTEGMAQRVRVRVFGPGLCWVSAKPVYSLDQGSAAQMAAYTAGKEGRYEP